MPLTSNNRYEAQSGPITEPHRYRNRVDAERVALVCSRLPVILLTQATLMTPLIVSLVWDVASPLEMAVWLIVHFAIVLAHGAVYLRYRLATPPARVSLELTLALFALGLYWAALLGYMFKVTPNFLYHLYIFLFSGSLSLLALIVLAEHVVALTAFATPQLLTLAVLSFARTEVRYVSLGVLGSLSIVAMILFGRAKHKNIVEALAIRFALMDMTQELKEQRDAAYRANVAKSKFLAAASHDLRQPLHALSLLSASLQDSNIDSRTRAIANDMSAAIVSLDKMYAALLDVSRLDAGVLQPQVRHFHLGEFLCRIADEFTPLAREKGLTLVCSPCAHIAHTDPVLLERIVRNFLSNAVRYTQTGRIEVHCRTQNTQLRIEVRDTGIGIAQDLQAQIFDEFFQIDNPERDRAKGMGLGLAIVRRIADLLHHPIGVQSSLGAGSCFYIDVPPGDVAKILTEPEAPRTQNLAGLRVVVIDDDSAVREGMRMLLSTWHCEAIIASDADEACRMATMTSNRPDALIVDLRLREQRTGFEAIELLRKLYGAEIPALIVSGDTGPEQLQAVQARGHAMVHKPVQPAALRAFLSTAMRFRNLRP